MELKIEQHNDDIKTIQLEREKKYKRINDLLKKSYDLKNRIYDIRYDESREDEGKEMDLKELLDNLMDVDEQLQQEVLHSTDYLIEQLSLKSIGADGIFETRKKISRPNTKPAGSTGAFLNSNSSLGTPKASQETPFYRPPSTIPHNESKRTKGPINALLRSLEKNEKEQFGELEQIEKEIADLRAALYSMEEKKNPNKTQARMIEDIRSQLKMKVAQKDALIKRTYVEHVDLESSIRK